MQRLWRVAVPNLRKDGVAAVTYLEAVTVRTIDNRDPEEMLRWYRARVEAMERRADTPACLRAAESPAACEA